MRLREETISPRRIPNWTAIRSISSSQFFMASMAAYWLMVGAHIMANWWSFSITLMISRGPAA